MLLCKKLPLSVIRGNYSFPSDSIDSRLARLVQKVHGSKNCASMGNT
jgi:hypothetical protein